MSLIHQRTWWTKDRVMSGLRRFAQDTGRTPGSTEAFHALTKGSGIGPRRRYPSAYAVLRWFPTFKAGWAAVGVAIGRSFEAWTEDEEDFLREGIGILTRLDLADALGRSPDAVHRRIYDLGLNSYQARGWTPHRIAMATGVTDHIIRSYMERGQLPYLAGCKVQFIHPSDIPIIREVDWQRAPYDLMHDVRRGLMERLTVTLVGRDWRSGTGYVSRPKPRNRAVIPLPEQWGRAYLDTPLKPCALMRGIAVEIPDGLEGGGARGAMGRVRQMYCECSRRMPTRRREQDQPRWMVLVEVEGTEGAKPRYVTVPAASVMLHSKLPEALDARRGARMPDVSAGTEQNLFRAA